MISLTLLSQIKQKITVFAIKSKGYYNPNTLNAQRNTIKDRVEITYAVISTALFVYSFNRSKQKGLTRLLD